MESSLPINPDDFEVLEEPKQYSRGGSAGMGGADVASMGFDDEMRGFGRAVGRYLSGKSDGSLPEAIKLGIEEVRGEHAQAQEDNPLSYMGGQVVGGIAQGGVAGMGAKALPNAVRQFAADKPLRALAGIGAVSGGLYGAGSGEGLEGKAKTALAMGTGSALAGPAMAKIGSTIGQPLAERARRLFRKTQPVAPQALTPESIAQQSMDIVEQSPQTGSFSKVERALRRDFGDDYDSVMDVYKGSDVSLAELQGAKTKTLAKGAAQYGEGQKVADNFFAKEVLESPDRAIKSIESNIGIGENYHAQVDDILEFGRKKAAPLYDDAYENILENIDILKTPEIQGALEKAYKQYPSELAGAEPNSIKALDYAKRILDDEIGKAQRAGEGNFARSRIGIKNNLLQAMDSASPAYQKARAASGDYLSLNQAMDDGKSFMKTDPELLAKKFKDLSAPEKTAFKSGVGKQLNDLIDKTNDGGNYYNKIFGKKEQQKRLASILSPEQFKRLKSDLQAEDRLFKLRNDVLGNSATTSKAIAAAEIAGGAADFVSMAGGNITNMPRNAVLSALKKSFDGINDKTAQQISSILYEKNPEKKLVIINQLGKNLSKEEAQTAKKIYFESLEQIDPYRFGGAASSATLPAAMSDKNQFNPDDYEIIEE